MDYSVLKSEFSDAIQTWERGSIIIEQGKPCDSLHVVLDGELEVWAETADRATVVDCVWAGECTGEVTLLDPGPATATVRAAAPTTTLQLRHEALRELWKRRPRVASALYSELLLALAGRLRSATCES